MLPRAVDGDTASLLFVGEGGTLRHAVPGVVRRSVDPSRRLVDVEPAAEVASADLHRAFDQAVLATSAQLLGLGEHGAIGYTAEHDRSRWFLTARELHGAWGTPTHARRRVLASLTGRESHG